MLELAIRNEKAKKLLREFELGLAKAKRGEIENMKAEIKILREEVDQLKLAIKARGE